MKKLLIINILFFSVLNLFADFVPGEIIIKYKDTLNKAVSTLSSIDNPYQVTSETSLYTKPISQLMSVSKSPMQISINNYQSKCFLIKLADPNKTEEAAKYFNSLNNVEFANPNYIYRQSNTIPNDTSFGNQGYIQLVHADDAWDISTGSNQEIIVAVIDSGVDRAHPDLVNRLVPESEDWNFYSGNSNMYDMSGHGTHVAGIIAAMANNGLGIAGLNWGCKILPLKVFDDSVSNPGASLVDITDAIVYAINHGAKVINMSLGGDYTSGYDYYLNLAHSAGLAIIVAAGNDNINLYSSLQSPVCNDGANNIILGVAATDGNNRASFSNYSTQGTYVDVNAPGKTIYSTIPVGYGSYGYKDGTSMATPIVSALASLIFSFDKNMAISDVYGYITRNLDTSIIDNTFPIGHGRVNFYNTLSDLANTPVAHIIPTETIKISSFYNYPNPFNNSNISTTFYLKLSEKPVAANIKIYSVLGKLIRNIEIDVANSQMYNSEQFVSFDGRDDLGKVLIQGIYFAVLTVQDDSGIVVKSKHKVAILNE